MDQQHSLEFDVVVVGGGVWAESVCECIQNAGKTVCSVYDHDDTELQAASNDVARIIRAEYSDPVYRQAAERALGVFHTDKTYAKYYHEPGWFLIQDAGDTRYASIPGSGEQVSIETVMRQFPAADLCEGAVITTTSKVGWVEANTLQAALRDNEGPSERIRGQVRGLLRNGTTCYGVRLEDREIYGKQVILATGWRTNQLLRTAALPILAYDIVGAVVLGVKLDEEQYAKYKDNKILCDPGQGEILPPTRERVLRVNNAHTYRFHEHRKSAPRVNSNHPCFEENKAFLKKYCSDLVDCPVVMARICMDALAECQTFYVEENHDLTNLHCVGGGSFHSWKFRPVLPDLIASELKFGNKDDIWRALLQSQSQKHAGVVPTRDWPEEWG